jgi:hypothetical protein
MSVGQNPPFAPSGIMSLAASTTSVGAALPSLGETLVVTNPTVSLAWVAVGAGTTPPTAVAGACIPVLPGQRRIIGAPGATQVSAVLTTGTGTIYVETGKGSAV